MASETQQTVELQRTVRFGRLLIGGAIAGGLIASLVSFMFPVPEGALYTVGQIAGFMLIIGGAFGLLVGGIVGLVLARIAKRQRGTGVIVAHSVVEEPATEVPEAALPEIDVPGAVAPEAPAATEDPTSPTSPERD